MDDTGIEYAVVSLTSPGVQGESDAAQACERARRSNDVLAEAIAAHPDRMWEFTTDTSASALRLITSGLLDRHPKLRVVLGHLGESVPYNIWRIENRMHKAHDRGATRPPTEFIPDPQLLDHHEWAFLHTQPHDSPRSHGESHVMFSVVYPYDDMEQGAAWFESLDLPLDVLRRVGRSNAAALLRLSGKVDTNGL